MRQSHTVDGSRHLDICENHSNIRPALQDRYRFVGRPGFKGAESRALKRINEVEADKNLVLHD
jgi:hypothetical protein